MLWDKVSKPSQNFDCLKICELKTSTEYSVGVTPTRHSFWTKSGNLVNTKPQRESLCSIS